MSSSKLGSVTQYVIRIKNSFWPKNKFQEEIVRIAHSDSYNLCSDPEAYYKHFCERIEKLRRVNYSRCGKENPSFNTSKVFDKLEIDISVNKLITIEFVRVKGIWIKP